MNHKKSKNMKRIVSGLLALTLLSGGAALPSDVMSNVASVLTAQAVSYEEDCYSFDETTKVLTLRGKLDRSKFNYFSRNYNYNVKKIIAEDGTVFPEDCSELFKGYSYCETIDLSKVDTSNVTNMFEMFYNCYNLTKLDVSSFDTSNVTNMSEMFYYCSYLTKLDVSSFDTSNVTKMDYMFAWCENLTSLDLRSFDTSKVTDSSYMFYVCEKLTSLDVSSFNTSKIQNMAAMFSNCKILPSLDVSGFDTSSVTNMKMMFNDCNALTPLDVSGFDTSNVTDMNRMFDYCTRLTSIDVSGFDTSSVTDMQGMFTYCTGLTSIDVSGFDTSNVINMGYMFNECNKLTSLNVSGFDTSSVTDMEYMFYNCTSLTSIDVSGFDTSSVTDMDHMFYDCASLTSLDLSGFDTRNVKEIHFAFSGCTSLTSVIIPKSMTKLGAYAFFYYDRATKTYKPVENLTIYCYPDTEAENYAKAHKEEGIKYQYLFPQNIKYKYSSQYRQLKLTWDKIEVADRYGIAVYIAGKWRMQTQNIPAAFTSYITRKNSVFVGSTYKVAVAARVNGKWDTANAIKNAVTVKISGSKPNNEDDNIEDIQDPVEPVTINDNFLDDSGSINGNNPQTNDFNGINEYLNKTLKMRSSTIPVSYEDTNGPRKNELIFTRTRKKDKSDAIFNLAPSKNSNFAFTITDTEETKFGIACTTDDYKSTVRIYNTNDNNHVTPLDIKLSDVEYFNDGTKMSKKITYYFALEKDKKYEISVNNPTNNHEGDYEIHVSEDNWYHIPPDKGGIAYADWLVCQGLTAKDYTMIYLPESKVKELVSTMNWEKTSDPFFNEDFIHAMSDRFYVDKNILKDITAKLSNDFSIAATYAGVVLAFTFPEATAIGAIVTCFGGSATTINLVSSKEDSSKSLFESSLEEATKDGKYDLCLSRYSYITNVPTYGTCLEWCSWNEEYLYKYIDGDTPIYFKPGIDVDNVNMYQYKEE